MLLYQVLYRKWRPTSFDDVVGQPHVVATLKNELKAGRLSHAYLFTGSRGTGKTTCAKILAKAVNCLSPHDGEPCNECALCRGIDDGTVMDVSEIDAASNTGVDSIRALQEESAYTPAAGKYRVYIIDEVHMLSASAFNALLKTLEEPPAHVIFILATTEVHKIPATILSRCQRFDFHRIPAEEIASRLLYIAGQENISLTPDAAALMARLADGALRDALSLLDRCASAGDVTVDTVTNTVGLAGQDHLYEISDAAAEGNRAALFASVDRLHAASKDMERLCGELISHYRNLMIVSSVKSPAKLLSCSADELTRLLNAASRYTPEQLIFALNILQNAAVQMRQGSDRRVELETALLRISSPELNSSTDALLARITRLEQQLRAQADSPMKTTLPQAAKKAVPAHAEPSPQPAAVTAEDSPPFDPDLPEPQELPQSPEPVGTAAEESPAAPSLIPPVPEDSGSREDPAEQTDEPSGEVSLSEWPEIVAAVFSANPLMGSVLKGSHAYLHDNLLLIDSKNPQFVDLMRGDPKNKADIKKAALAITGKSFNLGPYRHETAGAEQDPLADFVSGLRDKGIAVKTEES